MIIWLASYPKSGNTWVRAILNQILFLNPNEKNNVLSGLHKNLDKYPKIKHFYGLNSSFKKQEDFQDQKKIIQNWTISQERINQDKKVRLFKTHNMLCSLSINKEKYSFTNLKNTLGVIYIVRDPRNVITSLKNHFFFKTYAEAFEMMRDEKRWIGLTNKEVPQALCSWDQHYESWSFFPKNYILVRYEDLLSNPIKQIERLVVYLKKLLKINFSENKIYQIVKNTDFSYLKNLEKQGLFEEKAVNSKTNEVRDFFYLGPKNNYSKLLDAKTKNMIEQQFDRTMKRLGYL